MSDLISRQAAVQWVKTECNPYGNPTIDFESGKKVIEHLKRLPSVDAVPVVRCKECKHNEGEEPGMVYCPNFVGGWVSNDWFCANGERRTDETD